MRKTIKSKLLETWSMTHTCLNELWIEHPGIVTSVIYFFQLAQKCKMYCLLKTFLFTFFNMLQRKCWLLLSVVCFINSVTNRCISNALRTFKWQNFLHTDFLYLNEFLCAPLKKSLVGMYNMNEKNNKVKVAGKTFSENLNGKL